MPFPTHKIPLSTSIQKLRINNTAINKKKKVLDSSKIWTPLHFVDQNKNPAKCLKHYLRIPCLTISVHLSEPIRCHKVGATKNNLASIIM